jgi:hypothetical protein
MSRDDAVLWPGLNMLDREGAKIGRIEDVFVDPETGEPEWALVNTGLFGRRPTYVPLDSATEERQSVLVPYAKEHVHDAPNFDSGHDLSPADEEGIYRHYGLGEGGAPGEVGRREAAPAGRTGHGEGGTAAAGIDQGPAAPPGGGVGQGQAAPPGGTGDIAAGEDGRTGDVARREPTTAAGPPAAGTAQPAEARGAPTKGGPGASPQGAEHGGAPVHGDRPEHGGAAASTEHGGVGDQEGRGRRRKGGLRERIEQVLDRYTARREHDSEPDHEEHGSHRGREGVGAERGGALGGGGAREPGAQASERGGEPGGTRREEAGRRRAEERVARTPGEGPEPAAGAPAEGPEPAAGAPVEEPPLQVGEEIGRRRGADGRERRYIVTEVIDEPGEPEPPR